MDTGYIIEEIADEIILSFKVNSTTLSFSQSRYESMIKRDNEVLGLSRNPLGMYVVDSKLLRNYKDLIIGYMEVNNFRIGYRQLFASAIKDLNSSVNRYIEMTWRRH